VRVTYVDQELKLTQSNQIVNTVYPEDTPQMMDRAKIVHWVRIQPLQERQNVRHVIADLK